MSKAKPVKRDSRAEALEDIAGLLAAFPNRSAKKLLELGVSSYRRIREYIDGIGETAQINEFKRLMHAHRALTSDGRNVRGIMSHSKTVPGDDGSMRVEHQWKLFKDMDRDEAWDSLRDLRKNIRGCVAQHDTQADYWNELHPDYEPLPHYDECNGDDYYEAIA